MKEPTVHIICENYRCTTVPFSLAPLAVLQQIADGSVAWESDGPHDDPEISRIYARILLAERAA